MNTVLGETLQKALNNAKKTADYSAFVWKGEKRKEGTKYVQNIERMVDMSDGRLKECYKHCERMLHSENPKHLGRYNVLEEIVEECNKCNVELFLRYCENKYLSNENRSEIKRRPLWFSIRQFVEKKKCEEENIYDKSISCLTANLPSEFNDLTINDVLDGCSGDLGSYDKQHLTMTFITKMGLWFSKAEETELRGMSSSEKLKWAKEKLKLPEELILRYSDKGLSFKEMKAMLSLPKKQRYSDMTNEQLVVLRDKVLLRLQRQIDGHIYSWERLQKQLSLVAEQRGFDITE